MRTQRIRSEQEHDIGVARIADLIGAVPGTPEGDELDALATAADAWESEHDPIDPPSTESNR